jgi:ribosomal protein S27E
LLLEKGRRRKKKELNESCSDTILTMSKREKTMKDQKDRPLKGCAVEGRNVTPVECRCPECGHELEMFSDERDITCPQCGKDVTLEVCALKSK